MSERSSDAQGQDVVVERRGAVTVLRLNRPRVLNALRLRTLQTLAHEIRASGRAGEGALVVTGTGRAFSSGDDLDAQDALDRDGFEVLIEAFQDVTRAIFETRVPVIAALNGIAVGGGAEIACACDVRVGGPASDFLFPENRLGLTVSNGSTLTLPMIVGRRALALIALGERLSAARAFELGLIDVMTDGDVFERALAVAADIGASDRATRFHLPLLRPAADEMERALQRERDAALAAWDSGAPQTGVRRFLAARRS